ncbi:BrnT family toxin [Hyphomicrobium sp.]|uniref:BrnT family toxin n=1 Tax=Hyphomicrobium sp. TaxID=82 RepID=UPI0025BFCC0A|nr:BrnT family toxin [Hyphomicrobium sp.]MCC7253072.1 BrnT family toxin [Hyphomicrobium sp.]
MSASFDWDPDKDAENQRKHGVSFVYAQGAFLDPARVIARDMGHSEAEQRFYCFGQVPDGILTVRFTYRGKVIRIIGAGFWRRGKKLYEIRNKIHK